MKNEFEEPSLGEAVLAVMEENHRKLVSYLRRIKKELKENEPHVRPGTAAERFKEANEGELESLPVEISNAEKQIKWVRHYIEQERESGVPFNPNNEEKAAQNAA